MNMDHALLGIAVVSGLFGFLLGYAKGHEHGKYAGRIALRREQAAQQQVSR
jgi:hypothetical protein